MSTSFDVRKWARLAGIQTTGGFAVVAECVTLDELRRFAEIAMEAAAIELVKKNNRLDCIASELQDTCDKQAKKLAESEALLRQALEAFEELYDFERSHKQNAVVAAIQERLKMSTALEQPAVEPVARVIWPSASGLPNIEWLSDTSSVTAGMALFAAPQAQQPQLLTDEELRQIRKAKQGHDEFARAVEQAVLKKNGVIGGT